MHRWLICGCTHLQPRTHEHMTHCFPLGHAVLEDLIISENLFQAVSDCLRGDRLGTAAVLGDCGVHRCGIRACSPGGNYIIHLPPDGDAMAEEKSEEQVCETEARLMQGCLNIDPPGFSRRDWMRVAAAWTRDNA